MRPFIYNGYNTLQHSRINSDPDIISGLIYYYAFHIHKERYIRPGSSDHPAFQLSTAPLTLIYYKYGHCRLCPRPIFSSQLSIWIQFPPSFGSVRDLCLQRFCPFFIHPSALNIPYSIIMWNAVPVFSLFLSMSVDSILQQVCSKAIFS